MISFRPMELADRRFVIASWVASYRDSYSSGIIPFEDWYTIMYPVVDKLLDRPGIRTIVAYNPEAFDHMSDLHGFISADPEMALVLYVYVKEAFRRAGIARSLFRAMGIDPEARFSYACSTSAVLALARTIPYAKWRPLLARFRPKVSTNDHG